MNTERLSIPLKISRPVSPIPAWFVQVKTSSAVKNRRGDDGCPWLLDSHALAFHPQGPDLSSVFCEHPPSSQGRPCSPLERWHLLMNGRWVFTKFFPTKNTTLFFFCWHSKFKLLRHSPNRYGLDPECPLGAHCWRPVLGTVILRDGTTFMR